MQFVVCARHSRRRRRGSRGRGCRRLVLVANSCGGRGCTSHEQSQLYAAYPLAITVSVGTDDSCSHR